MPLNSFHILRVLANQGEDYELEHITKAFEPFNLFAFIIHDPEKDPEFHEFISRQFDLLDYLTGNKLLFFALVDPPEEWLRDASNRSYVENISWFTEQILDQKNYPQTDDPSISAYALAKWLGIDYKNLPCIVITRDFRESDYFWFRTNKDQLINQLTQLGYLAERGQHLELELHTDKFATETEKPFHTTLDVSLAKVLFPLISSMVDHNDYKYASSKEISRKAIFSLIIKQEWIYRRSGKASENVSEKLSLLIGLASGYKKPEVQEMRERILPISKQYLEQDSEIMLRTATIVYRALTEGNSLLNNQPQYHIDYSPGIISLCKPFEREINLSIVHFLRKHVGIQLPEYFDTYQDSPSIRPHIERARLNEEKNGIWLPPALGDSKRAFTYIYRQGLMPPKWTPEECDMLFDFWDKIHHWRNPAAHQDLSNLEALEDLLRSLNGLNSMGYFSKLYQLKTYYRGY